VALSLYSFGQGAASRSSVGDSLSTSTCTCSSITTIPEQVFESAIFRNHAKNVVHMLEMVMGMMLGDDMDGLAESLHALGSRHVTYGVQPVHFGAAETALLRVLRNALGEDLWTEPVRKGWAAVFKFISKAMMTGAHGASVAALRIVKDKGQQGQAVGEEDQTSTSASITSTSTQKASSSSISGRKSTMRLEVLPNDSRLVNSTKVGLLQHPSISSNHNLSSTFGTFKTGRKKGKRHASRKRRGIGRQQHASDRCYYNSSDDTDSLVGISDIIFETSTISNENGSFTGIRNSSSPQGPLLLDQNDLQPLKPQRRRRRQSVEYDSDDSSSNSSDCSSSIQSDAFSSLLISDESSSNHSNGDNSSISSFSHQYERFQQSCSSVDEVPHKPIRRSHNPLTLEGDDDRNCSDSTASASPSNIVVIADSSSSSNLASSTATNAYDAAPKIPSRRSSELDALAMDENEQEDEDDFAVWCKNVGGNVSPSLTNDATLFSAD
jgi:hypothetical protein